MAQVKNEHMIGILQMSRKVFQLIVTQILQINEEASEFKRQTTFLSFIWCYTCEKIKYKTRKYSSRMRTDRCSDHHH